MKKFFLIFAAFSMVALSASADAVTAQKKWVRMKLTGEQSIQSTTSVLIEAKLDGGFNFEGHRPIPSKVEDLYSDGAYIDLFRKYTNDVNEKKLTHFDMGKNIPHVTFGIRSYMPNIYSLNDNNWCEGYIIAREKNGRADWDSTEYSFEQDGDYTYGKPYIYEHAENVYNYAYSHCSRVSLSDTTEKYVFLPKGAYAVFGLDSVFVTGDCYMTKSGSRPVFAKNSDHAPRVSTDLNRSAVFVPRGAEFCYNGEKFTLNYNMWVTLTIAGVAQEKYPTHQLDSLYLTYIADEQGTEEKKEQKKLVVKYVFQGLDKLVGMLIDKHFTADFVFEPEWVKAYGPKADGESYGAATKFDAARKGDGNIQNGDSMHVYGFEQLRKEYPNAVATTESTYAPTLEEENVISVYKNANTCENLVLTDICEAENVNFHHLLTDDEKAILTKYGFKAPIDFTAENLSYSRKLSAGYNSICLPFAFEVKSPITEVYSFKEYDAANYNLNFNVVSNPVAATPYFMMASAGDYIFVSHDPVEIKKDTVEAEYMKGTFVTDNFNPYLSVSLTNGYFATLQDNLYAFRACCSYPVNPVNNVGARLRLVVDRSNTPTAIENTTLDASAAKVLVNGKILVRKGNANYDMTGRIVK